MQENAVDSADADMLPDSHHLRQLEDLDAHNNHGCFDLCRNVRDRLRTSRQPLPLRRTLLFQGLTSSSSSSSCIKRSLPPLSEQLANMVDQFVFYPGVVSDANIHFLVRVVVVGQATKQCIIQLSHGRKGAYCDLPESMKSTSQFMAQRQCKQVNAYFGPMDQWDTSLVTDMCDLFCFLDVGMGIHVRNLNLAQWDVSNVRDLSWAFAMQRYGLPWGLQCWDVSNVRHMVGTFFGSCAMHRQFPGRDARHEGVVDWMFLRQWQVHNVEDMRFLFAESSFDGTSITSTWDVGKVKSATCMLFCDPVRFLNTAGHTTLFAFMSSLSEFVAQRLEETAQHCCANIPLSNRMRDTARFISRHCASRQPARDILGVIDLYHRKPYSVECLRRLYAEVIRERRQPVPPHAPTPCFCLITS